MVFGSATSPCCSPAASKYGTCSGSCCFSTLAVARLRGAFGLGASAVSVVFSSSAITRGPRKIAHCLGRSYLSRVGLAGRTLGHLSWLGGLAVKNESALGTGHATLQPQQIAVRVDSNDLVGAGGDPLVAHLPCHAHALEHARGVCRADGAGLADVHGAVRFRAAAELVALD